MDCIHADTEEGDVINIRQVGEVEIFPRLDTLRTSKGTFKEEVYGLIKLRQRHMYYRPVVHPIAPWSLLFLGLLLSRVSASRKSRLLLGAPVLWMPCSSMSRQSARQSARRPFGSKAATKFTKQTSVGCWLLRRISRACLGCGRHSSHLDKSRFKLSGYGDRGSLGTA